MDKQVKSDFHLCFLFHINPQFSVLLSTLSTLAVKPLFYLTLEPIFQRKQFLLLNCHSFVSKNIA